MCTFASLLFGHLLMPPTLPWHSAPDTILRAAAGGASLHPVRLVGITGPAGAGKSTLAARVSACVLSTDHYLPDYERVPYQERDEPRHADLARLAADLASLRRGEPTRVPVWSFQTHRREGEALFSPIGPGVAPGSPFGGTGVPPVPVLIIEGIHALHESVRGLLDVRVYVEAPAAVRWTRWEDLERRGERGWGVEEARRYFHGVADPTFGALAAEYRGAADYVVRNDLSFK